MRATPEEYAFHQRMLADDDPTAFAELAERVYASLVHDTLARVGSSVDAALVEEAVIDVLLDYHDAPQHYDPERSSLRGYLVMAASYDVKNALAKERRRTRYAISLADSSLLDPDIADERQDVEAVLSKIHAEKIWRAIQASFPRQTEQRIILLMADHVRSPQPYVQLLGIADLPEDEQAKEVKRAKDRIKKRLRRIGENLNE